MADFETFDFLLQGLSCRYSLYQIKNSILNGHPFSIDFITHTLLLCAWCHVKPVYTVNTFPKWKETAAAFAKIYHNYMEVKFGYNCAEPYAW